MDHANPPPALRVLIVAEHASARFGGESILPLHYFRGLRRRGIETWMIVHDRTRPELTQLLGADINRVRFLPDRRLHRLLGRLRPFLPGAVYAFGPGMISRLTTQWAAKSAARRMIAEHHIDVVHQPMPVSPREVSLLYKLGAPVVIGPMNGGMTYPPAFRKMANRTTRGFISAGRSFSNILNRLLPGKLQATTLLVANDRTRAALPRRSRARVQTLVENGVDSRLWTPGDHSQDPNAPVQFLFCGRFDHWKGIDILLQAFAQAVGGTTDVASASTQPSADVQLTLIGDGASRPAYEAQATQLGIANRVRFRGWLPQEQCAREMRQADVLVLPSLYECGGAVVLEAMACALPVIATNWGGPADYLTPQSGILVDPIDRVAFVNGLAGAMRRLAAQPQWRKELGDAGRARAVALFDWERKIDAILDIYADAVCRYNRAEASPRCGTSAAVEGSCPNS
jgi:glycosyltransferase involved in cell wall biosynthesis